MSLAKSPMVFLPAAQSAIQSARLPVITQDFQNEDGDVNVQALSPFLICEHTEGWVKMTHQVRWQNRSKPAPTASPDTNGTRSQNTGNSVRWLSETLSLECQSVCLMHCRKREFCWSSVAAIMCHRIKDVAHLHGFSCIARQRYSLVISFCGGAQ